MKRWFMIPGVIIAAYYVATLIFFNTGLFLRILNSATDDLKVDYRYAYSWFPGQVTFRDLGVRIEDSSIQLYIDLPKANLFCDLFSLPQMEFHLKRLTGSGLSFRLRQKKNPKEIQLIDFQELPPIPGLPGFAKQPRPSSEGKTWKIRLDEVAIAEVRQVWIDKKRFQGRARLEGGLYLWTGGKELELPPSRLYDLSGGIYLGITETARGLQGEVAVQIDRLSPEKTEGVAFFEKVSGKVVGSAVVPVIRFINPYFSKAQWLKLEEGEARLRSDLHLTRGELEPGGRFSLDTERVKVAIWKQRLHGDGSLVITTSKRGGSVDLALNKYQLEPASSLSKGRIEGRDFSLKLETKSRDPFASPAFHYFALSLPKAKISDIRIANGFLPPLARAHFVGGTGTVGARLRGNPELPYSDSGEILFSVTGVRAQLNRKEVGGSLDFRAKLQRSRIEKGFFDLSGSKLSFRQIAFGENKEWWADLELPLARVALGETPSMRGEVRMRAQSARPILGVYELLGDHLPGIAKTILEFEGLQMQARVRLSDELFRVAGLKIKGDGSELRGWMEKTADHRIGKWLLSYGVIALGLGLDDEGTHVRLQDAYRWYDVGPTGDARWAE